MSAIFELDTACPAGHPVHMRRDVDIWCASLEAPSIILWCHECGLQWDGSARDRMTLCEVVQSAKEASLVRNAVHVASGRAL